MQTFLLILTATLAPALFRFWYIRKKDALHPESKKLLTKLFLRGMIIVFPAALLEVGIETIIPIEIITLVLVAPIVEELLKYKATKKITENHEAFDQPIDGIIYACAVGLGFAACENVFYVRDAYNTGSFEIVATIRALITIPAHALFASMRGYAMSLAKFTPNADGKKIQRNGLMLGILFHAGLNALTLFSVLGSLGLLVLTIVMRKLFHKRANALLLLQTKNISDTSHVQQ